MTPGAPLAVITPLWIESLAVRSALPEASVARCGMGRANAKRFAASYAYGRPGRRALAVAGVCGSLDPRIVPGDVIVATDLLGDGPARTLESAKPLARALESRGIAVHLGAIRSLDHLGRRAERESLRAAGAIAIDMESAWLAALADEAPFAVLRVVSDGPGHELWSTQLFANGIRALRALRAAAPALATWADSLDGET